MIIIFGPAGSGKSLQSQILSARLGWRWLSAGQLLRDLKDSEISKIQHTGALVDSQVVNNLIAKAIKRSKDEVDRVILDGYPREITQAQWLIEQEYPIALVIVINVPRREVLRRLKIRGRADDISTEAVSERLEIYEKDIQAIRELFTNHKIRIIDVDGTGTVGEVHDRITNGLKKCKLA